ncbi:MAG: fused MFS/spermidine synthase [Dethiobacteria bacterium]
MSPLTGKWFIEYTHPSQAHMYGIEQYVYDGKTPFQSIEIVDTDFFGRCLILNGKIQSAQFDEYIYHEALVHPAMVIHPLPKKVLVVGGGEGAALREILKHPSVEKLVMVDIDQDVVKLCRQYLPTWSNGAFDDPRVEVHFMDARKYLEENEAKWDIIIIDLTEPLDHNSPSYLLFTKEFYQLVAQRVKEKGGIALQADNLNPRLLQYHGSLYNTLKLTFKYVDSYGAYIPSFDSKWGFIYASQDYCALDYQPSIIDARLGERNIHELQFYDGLTHLNLFTLTKDLRVMRSKEKRIIEDHNPFFTY